MCISFENDLKKNEIVTHSRCYFNKSKDLNTYFKYSNSFFPEAVFSMKCSLLLDQTTTKSPASGLSDEMNRMSENAQSKHKVLGPHSADISNTTMHKPMFEPQKPLKNKKKRTQTQKQKRAEKRNMNKAEKMRKGKGRRTRKAQKRNVKKFDKNVANKNKRNKNKPKKGNNRLKPHLGYLQYDDEKSRKDTGRLQKENRIKPDKNRRPEKKRKGEQQRNLKKIENAAHQNKLRKKKSKKHETQTKKVKTVEGDDNYVYSYFD